MGTPSRASQAKSAAAASPPAPGRTARMAGDPYPEEVKTRLSPQTIEGTTPSPGLDIDQSRRPDSGSNPCTTSPAPLTSCGRPLTSVIIGVTWAWRDRPRLARHFSFPVPLSKATMKAPLPRDPVADVVDVRGAVSVEGHDQRVPEENRRRCQSVLADEPVVPPVPGDASAEIHGHDSAAIEDGVDQLSVGYRRRRGMGVFPPSSDGRPGGRPPCPTRPFPGRHRCRAGDTMYRPGSPTSRTRGLPTRWVKTSRRRTRGFARRDSRSGSKSGGDASRPRLPGHPVRGSRANSRPGRELPRESPVRPAVSSFSCSRPTPSLCSGGGIASCRPGHTTLPHLPAFDACSMAGNPQHRKIPAARSSLGVGCHLSVDSFRLPH